MTTEDQREIEEEFCTLYLEQLERIIVEVGRNRDRSMLSDGARVWDLLSPESRTRILLRWKQRQGWSEPSKARKFPDPVLMAELEAMNRAAIIADRGFSPRPRNTNIGAYVVTGVEPTPIPLWRRILVRLLR